MNRKQFFVNLFIYLLIILGGIFLYFPFNNSSGNKPTSGIRFVYQQF